MEDTDRLIRILHSIHQTVRPMIMTLTEQASRDGLKPPFRLQILSDETLLTELTVGHNGGVWAWDQAQYAKLIPLAANPNVMVEFILVPGERHLTTMLDFSDIDGDYITEARLI